MANTEGAAALYGTYRSPVFEPESLTSAAYATAGEYRLSNWKIYLEAVGDENLQ